jgi:hypothetical protein
MAIHYLPNHVAYTQESRAGQGKPCPYMTNTSPEVEWRRDAVPGSAM